MPGDVRDELIRRLAPDARQYIFDPGTGKLSPSPIVLVNGHSIGMDEGLNMRLLASNAVTIGDCTRKPTINNPRLLCRSTLGG